LIEKSCQLMMALFDAWITVSVLPLELIAAEPATTSPLVGLAQSGRG
jgi:hypothetical protein